MPRPKFSTKIFSSTQGAVDTSSGVMSSLKRVDFFESAGKLSETLKSSALVESVLKGVRKNDSLVEMLPTSRTVTSFGKKADDFGLKALNTVDQSSLKRFDDIMGDYNLGKLDIGASRAKYAPDIVDGDLVKKLDDVPLINKKSITTNDLVTKFKSGSTLVADKVHDGLKFLKRFDGTIQVAIISSYFLALHVRGEAPWSSANSELGDPVTTDRPIFDATDMTFQLSPEDQARLIAYSQNSNLMATLGAILIVIVIFVII